MEFAHHYHSSHPEKQNVVSGLKNVRRMIGLKIGSFFRPAQSRKGPKSRGKPGIKHVGVLLPLARRSFSACLPVRQGGGGGGRGLRLSVPQPRSKFHLPCTRSECGVRTIFAAR